MPRFVPSDTSPDAQAVQDEIYRRLGGRERVAIAFRLSATARTTTCAGIRRRHPQYSDAQVHAALARLLFGDELVRQAWPDAPLGDP
jgi:hypothetical protein